MLHSTLEAARPLGHLVGCWIMMCIGPAPGNLALHSWGDPDQHLLMAISQNILPRNRLSISTTHYYTLPLGHLQCWTCLTSQRALCGRMLCSEYLSCYLQNEPKIIQLTLHRSWFAPPWFKHNSSAFLFSSLFLWLLCFPWMCIPVPYFSLINLCIHTLYFSVSLRSLTMHSPLILTQDLLPLFMFLRVS